MKSRIFYQFQRNLNTSPRYNVSSMKKTDLKARSEKALKTLRDQEGQEGNKYFPKQKPIILKEQQFQETEKRINMKPLLCGIGAFFITGVLLDMGRPLPYCKYCKKNNEYCEC